MRCNFMRDGHIGAVAIPTGASGVAAIAQAQALFEQCKAKPAGFEVRDRARFVCRFSPDRDRRREGGQ